MNAVIAVMENNKGLELRLPHGAILHCENEDLQFAFDVCVANAEANHVDYDLDQAVIDLGFSKSA